MRNRVSAAAAFLIITGLICLSRWPDYKLRRTAERDNKTVSIALDFEDVYAAAGGERRAVRRALEDLKRLPVSVMALSEKAPSEDERLARSAGFSILWQIQTTDYAELEAVLARVKPGDGCLSTEKQAPGYPMYLSNVAHALLEKNGFLPLFEFLPQKGMSSLSGKLEGSLIKAHLIGDREVFTPRPLLWKMRLLRAARERGVRLFYLRLSPSLTFEESRTFLDSVAVSLAKEGFTLGRPRPFAGWVGKPARLRLALFLAVAGPVLGLWMFGLRKKDPVLLRYVVFCGLSVLTGVTVYLLGSSERTALGVGGLRGVKLQLLLPLMFGVVMLVDRRGWKKRFDMALKLKHVLFAGGVLGVLLVLYLMRSGNFPLIPVSDAERHFRDGLENFFGARPRFKEFFIGHPALIAAFACQRLGIEARYFLLLGLIGQISIVNTFLHFHMPLELGLLRTFHGIWIGAVLSLPFCWALKQWAAYSKPKTKVKA